MSTNASQLERLTFFSDAVFAIAITLLVIEIHVPRLGVASDHAYLDALGELGPSFFGFVLSFLVIGALWASHHRVFGMLADYDRRLVMPNILLLMLVAFMPFATALMSSNPVARVPKLFYSATLLLAGLLQCWLFGRALHAPYLRAHVTRSDVAAARARSWALPMAAVLSLVMAWFVPAFSNLVLLLIPVLTRLLPRIATARLARREAVARGT
ncbi:MAG: TMEM175 family protein [Rhodanobacter sp.]